MRRPAARRAAKPAGESSGTRVVPRSRPRKPFRAGIAPVTVVPYGIRGRAVPGGMQVAVEEALPAPRSVDGGADVQLPRLDRVGELVEVEQALVAPVNRDQDVDVQVPDDDRPRPGP